MGNILMNQSHPDEPTLLHPTSPFLPVLLVLFGGSGCSALIYEIVWFQLLELVIGSSAVSLAVLLGTFMGGMCLGSVLLPRIISARRHPLRVYALLELGIGLIALVVLFGLPHADRLYAASLGHGLRGIVLRGLVAAVCLLPPALLMGGTLPAIARWIETTRQGVSWLGFFYGANIAGAVFGCLLAGFYLLRVHDTATATVVAATINGGGCPDRTAPRRSHAEQSTEGRGNARAGCPWRRPLGGVRRYCLIGDDRSRRGGGLDAPAVAAARRDGVHLLDYPRCIPDGPGTGQQCRLVPCAHGR
jgi:hypothetical protein